MDIRKSVLAILTAAAVLVAAGCGSPESTRTTTQVSPTATSPTPAPTVSSLFDPQWMGVAPPRPNGWQEINRTITADFQQFDFRPVDETEYRRRCNGCAPWTATLTVYAPGKFDPADARRWKPASVNGADDGYFRPTDDTDDTVDATLAWQYADNAWATAVGLTSATGRLEELTELAHALKPAEHKPIRLPLSFANLPAAMPLAEINIDTSPLEDDGSDYGTTVEFAPCGSTVTGAVPDCKLSGDSMSVHIWPNDYRPPTGGIEHATFPVKVGGKDGVYDDTSHQGAVQLQPGTHVEFGLYGPSYPDNRAALEQILADVDWAPNPADEATWRPVSDWVK